MATRKNQINNRERRQKDAKERQEDYSNRSPKDQLDILNVRLGEGKGALKERFRLQNIIK